MFVNQFIEDFSMLGRRLSMWLAGGTAEPFLDDAVVQAHVKNPFFTPYMQRRAIGTIAETFLAKEELVRWLAQYARQGRDEENGKKIGIIMAGNIPLVGFHDFFCVLASGRKALVKLSSKDNVLLPAVFKVLCAINACWREKVIFLNTGEPSGMKNWRQEMEGIAALISTGSDTAGGEIRNEFASLPALIRGRRFSFAVIAPGMKENDLSGLSEDVFLYYGLGCRNIGYFLVPQKYEIKKLADWLGTGRTLVDDECYRNIYKRNKAILLMEGEDFTDGGFFILRETQEEILPVGVLGYRRYASREDVEAFEIEKNGIIQKKYCTFGKAQSPRIDEYADGVDTMKFILEN